MLLLDWDCLIMGSHEALGWTPLEGLMMRRRGQGQVRGQARVPATPQFLSRSEDNPFQRIKMLTNCASIKERNATVAPGDRKPITPSVSECGHDTAYISSFSSDQDIITWRRAEDYKCQVRNEKGLRRKIT